MNARPPRSRVRATPWCRLALFAALLLGARPAPLAAQSGDAFVCYSTRPADGAAPSGGTTIEVRDEWSQGSLDLRRAKLLCAPADVGGGVADPAVFLRGYASRTPRHAAPPPAQSGIHTTNLLGDRLVDRDGAPQLFLTPSAVDASTDPAPPAPGSHAVDHFRCHRARSAAPFASDEITVQDGLSAARPLRLTKLLHECVPVDAQGVDIIDPARELQCYRTRAPRRQPRRGLRVADAFAGTRVDAFRERELCLPTRAVAACNRFAPLCDRAFDAVSYPTTHNAMSNAEEGWFGPNQHLTITHQLEAGVRALMLDTWYLAGQPVLCHAGDVVPCDITGNKPLADGLLEIKLFLDRHPNEVVSIIFESYISELDTQTAFFASGLIAYTYAHPAATPWPSLRTLVDNDTRLVVFTDDGSAALPWHHYVWDHAWETHYSFYAPEDFSCAKNRGSLANPLFILNHFLTRTIGSPTLAEMVNHNPLFINRALQCRSESGRLPNFVTVDFFDIGDLFAVVDALNGV